MKNKRVKRILSTIVAVFVFGLILGILVGAMCFPKTVTITEYIEKPEKPEKSEDESYYPLSDDEYTQICRVVMAEAGGESFDGQKAVAQCILDACEKEGIRPLEVVTEYQYTPIRKEPSESVKSAVTAVFKYGETVTDEEILYFYAPKYCSSEWHENQKFVLEIGGHRFFAEND